MHEVDEQSSFCTIRNLLLFNSFFLFAQRTYFNIVILRVHNIPATIHFAASLPFLLQNPIPSHFTVESIHFYFPSAPFHFQPTRFLEGKPRKHSKLVGARVGSRGDEWLNSGLGEIGNQCRASRREKGSWRGANAFPRDFPGLATCVTRSNPWSWSIKEPGESQDAVLYSGRNLAKEG